MPAGANMDMSMRIVTVVMPVAAYFLILGLLNSRRHPQMLTCRRDFALLITALCPLLFVPIVGVWGWSAPALVMAGAILAAAVVLLAPPGRSWVVYNIPADAVRSAVSHVLRKLGVQYSRDGGDFVLHEQTARLEISGFAFLSNATIRLRGGDGESARSFQKALSDYLATTQVEPSLMAISLLLVATAMLAAPLALMAQRAPEIVRILTDLLY